MRTVAQVAQLALCAPDLLGQRNRIDRIEVRWIGGGLDVFEDVAVDQLLTITQGSSSPAGSATPDDTGSQAR